MDNWLRRTPITGTCLDNMYTEQELYTCVQIVMESGMREAIIYCIVCLIVMNSAFLSMYSSEL